METRSGPDGEYFVVVVEEEKTGKVVGTGTLVLEKKFLRNLGVCGHVEDIAVARECQGLRLGQGIIRVLDGIAEGLGCYKVWESTLLEQDIVD